MSPGIADPPDDPADLAGGQICGQVSGRAVRVPDSLYTNTSPRITQKEKPLTSVNGFRLVEN